MAILYIPIDSHDEITTDEVDCNECMQSLKGCKPGDLCPQCKYPILSTIGERPIVEVDARGLIANATITCANCSHSLYGIIPSGVCPECRHEVIRSLRSGLIQFAPASWLKTVRTGIVVSLLAVVLAIILLIVAIAMGVMKVDQTTILFVATGLGAIVGVTKIAAVFMTTTSCEQAGLTHVGDSLRAPLRTLVILSLIYGLVIAVPAKIYPAYGQLLGMPGLLISIVTWFMFIYYVGKLAELMPDPALPGKLRTAAKWYIGVATTMAIGFTISSVGSIPIVSVVLAAKANGTAPPANPAVNMTPLFWGMYAGGGLLGCGTGLACLAIFVYAYILMWKFRSYAGKALQAIDAHS